MPDGRHYVVYWEETEGKKKQRRQYFGRGDLERQKARLFDEDLKKKKGKIVDGLTTAQLCNMYHEMHPVEASTRKNDDYKFKKCLLPVLGHKQADMLSFDDLDGYINIRKEEGVKNITILREISLLKAALQWGTLRSPKLIAHNPIRDYKSGLKNDQALISPPTIQEVQAILAHAEPHLVRAIYIFWYTGIRSGGELTRIRWIDVDFGQSQFMITSAKKGGASSRIVPIDPESELKGLLAEWIEEDKRNAPGKEVLGLPVVCWRGEPVVSLKRAWGTAKAAAGIQRRMRLYDLRHGYATHALRAGADLKAVSQNLGHSRPDTTIRVYQHVIMDDRRQAAKLIPRLGPPPDRLSDKTDEIAKPSQEPI